MKRYIYLLVLLALTFSCSDFLDEEPLGVLTPDVFYTTDQLLPAADALPASFRGLFNNAHTESPHMGGDDLTAHPASNKLAFREVDIFSVSDNNDRIRAWWSVPYNTIRIANTILLNADRSLASEEIKNDVKGTAYFYRAISYAFLTRIFGRVPLILEEDYNPDPDLNVQKAEVAEIYDQIVSDMQMAEELLPNVRPESPNVFGGYPGAKPCKGTVKALMSQVYLTMAGWPLKETSNYALAATKAKEVIDNASTYGYELQVNPQDLWTWANNYSNKEIILGAYFNFESGEQSMHGPLCTRPEDEIIHGWAAGWTDYYAEISFFNRFPAGPRKDATFSTIIDGLPWNDPGTLRQHPYFKKYREDHPDASWIGARTYQIIRYAEVLLNYAEAQAMADGAPNQDAYDAINAIRNRAGLADLTTGLTAEQFRDSVIVERGWEFAGGEPASRWFDLIRTETLEQATTLRDGSEVPLAKSPTHDDYWLPIPSIDAVVNPNLND